MPEAIMSAAVVAPIAPGDYGYYITVSAALALVVGLILIGAGLARRGADDLYLNVIEAIDDLATRHAAIASDGDELGAAVKKGGAAIS